LRGTDRQRFNALLGETTGQAAGDETRSAEDDHTFRFGGGGMEMLDHIERWVRFLILIVILIVIIIGMPGQRSGLRSRLRLRSGDMLVTSRGAAELVMSESLGETRRPVERAE